MSAQQTLPLSSPPPSNTVIINARCSFRMEADQRAIVVAGLPVHHYRAEDTAAEAYAMVFLVESGFALQADVARAFGCSVRTVRRNQRRYAQGGMAALGLRFPPGPSSSSSSPPVDDAGGAIVADFFFGGGISGSASCLLAAPLVGPTSLRMAFSVTPSLCAIARLLIPWLFICSMRRRRFAEMRRRPRRQPVS